MNRIQAALAIALVASAAACDAPSAFAQTIKSGRTITVSERKVAFPKATSACLKMCLDIVVEKQTFDCDGFFEPPTTGCDLMWIDSENSNPDPRSQCIPPELEFGGYLLSEHVELVDRRVTQRADCTSSVSETTIQTVPNHGNPPRPCPDPAGWSQTNETVQSIRFVPCP